MGYIESNLLPEERVVYKANIHWFIFVPGAASLISGFIFLSLDSESGTGLIYGSFLVFFGMFSLSKALIHKLSAELAITSKRAIAKIGFIRRHTVELNHSKVESFNVDQSIFGRMLGYGTVVINGTGGGKTSISNIDAPLDFRREAMQTIDASPSK